MEIILDFRSADGTASRRWFRNPLRVIAARKLDDVLPALHAVDEASRAGHWCVGFISYEASPAFDAAMHVRGGGRMPLLMFGVFSSFDQVAPVEPQAAQIDWRENVTEDAYHDAIERIQDAIRAGETYQVNFTTRLRGSFEGNARAWYERLRASQGGGWHAFIDTGEHTVVSVSPELFFARRGSFIETRPMKGTMPRGRWLDEDVRHLRALRASEKDRAENLMIVDLLRNDIGRVAETGSVAVPSLFDAEKYHTVWQLTSRVTGTLRDDVSLADIFRALFPCGSVTGAPKINTMKWIADLEDSPREVYCGAIGVVEPGGDCTFNVPIRTVWLDNVSGRAEYGAGGGITADSGAELELAELRSKALVLTAERPAFDLLETMRVEDGVVVRRDLHMQRLQASAAYFDRDVRHDIIAELLDEAARGCSSARLRLLVAANGSARIERSVPAPPRYEDLDACRSAGGLQRVVLAEAPADSRDPFLCNKTTHRATYDAARARAPDAFDVLLWNERHELTEFTLGNLVVRIGGTMRTPPRTCGLLAGTFREELLAGGTVQEAVLKLDDLLDVDRMWLINSVREWVEVELHAVNREYV